MKKIFFTLICACAMSLITLAQNVVTVDFNNVIKSGVKQGASAANLCWLIDSDEKRPNASRSMEQAISDVGFGSLRFPYGHLADNYFWHTAPYDDTKNGLRPKIATTTRPPAKWDWAMEADGSFVNAMDFDEFMALCQRQNIAPLVVVNTLSFKYKDGPSIEQLATSAAEWVKYAKKKNYKVAYWQLGNEIDHHPKVITMEEFVKAYKTIASAMKKVDPTANIGPGILGKQNYFTTLYNEAPELVDFTSCHQYMWSFVEKNKTYELWSKANQSYIPNVMKMQKAVMAAGAKDMEIVVTESGVTPAGKGMGDVNNAYKALWWFEVLMSELKVPNVAYSYFWGTHTPWKGLADDDKNDIGVMFRVDNNSNKPIADVSELVNANLLTQFVGTKSTSKALRVYSTVNDDKTEGTIFIMNKLKTPVALTLDLINAPKGIEQLDFSVLSAKGPYVRKMNYKKSGNVIVKSGKASLNAAPISITVLRYKL